MIPTSTERVYVATGVPSTTEQNIGCGLHIAQGLREQNLTVSVLHPIQIIAQQMRFTGTI